MSAKSASREMFLSYVAEDESLCLQLEKHLSLLERERLITPWHIYLLIFARATTFLVGEMNYVYLIESLIETVENEL